MKRSLLLVAGLLAIAPLAHSGQAEEKGKQEQDRLQNANTVFQEILNVPNTIPQDLLDKARCVIVVPSIVKAAGDNYGHGVTVCRGGSDFTGNWGAPAMYALEGGNMRFHVGDDATDFVFLVMSDRGATNLLQNKVKQVKLGGDLSAAAGPLGSAASSDTAPYMHADVIGYSRSKGMLTGVNLEGSTVRPDQEANGNLYGRPLDPTTIISSDQVQVPTAANNLIASLQTASPQLKDNRHIS
jgi:SH3 domain-containing YSC84-like protein 1